MTVWALLFRLDLNGQGFLSKKATSSGLLFESFWYCVISKMNIFPYVRKLRSRTGHPIFGNQWHSLPGERKNKKSNVYTT